MKITTLIIACVCSFFSAVGQNFEGEIIYSNSYKSKIEKVSDEQFLSMMGSTQNYFIKSGEYKSVLNGSFLQWQLYKNKENKLFFKMANSETIFWNDCGVPAEEIISTELHKNVITLLGYSCDELVLTSKNGIQKYYFNSKIAIDPALFAKHKLGNWYDFVSKSKAIPLKSIIETAQFVLESVATKLIPMQLDQAVFELPVGVKTEKSPY